MNSFGISSFYCLARNAAGHGWAWRGMAWNEGRNLVKERQTKKHFLDKIALKVKKADSLQRTTCNVKKEYAMKNGRGQFKKEVAIKNREIIRKWLEKNPDKTLTDCKKATGFSYVTVRRHVDAIKNEK